MNEKFFSLPEKRQDLIRSSAMLEFGENTFKKTSADAIAKRAGVSKGLLFHYFKDKRELYLYLYQYALDVCVKHYMLKSYDFGETDFFLALEMGHKVKMDLMGSTIRDFLSRMDLYKFKEGVDPYQVIRLLLLAAEGMLAETNASSAEEINALFAEYKRHADMLRQFLYKEEYL